MIFKRVSVRKRGCFPFLLFLFFLLAACPAREAFKTKPLLISTAEGEVKLTVEIAETAQQRQRGLMFRKELADGKGMLFIFERDQTLSFWMKNTLIPLSIAFISSEGHILEIRDMMPQSLATVPSSRSCRYALEVPQGWFGRAKVNAGDMLLLTDF